MASTADNRVSPTGDFNVVLVGAGNIMFGSGKDPWNHSLRLEQKLGSRLKVIAIIDPDTERATAILQKKRDSPVVSAYQDTRVCKSLDDFVDTMTPRERPRTFIVGSPPMFRGSLQIGKDVEIRILRHFPGVPIFIEKPIATGPFEHIKDGYQIAKMVSDSKTICSVGYMLRYLKAVQIMKRIIKENNLTVMCTVARYSAAYTSILKPDWWNKSKSAGPIIEQGTHFCDLSRYFGGEVDLSTVQAHSLEWDESPGQLSKLPFDENAIPPEDRISRVTATNWKYASGAVGSLTHIVALHDDHYSCELEVYADGYLLKLVNPYGLPVLHVRKPGNRNEQITEFPDDDPFFSEISTLVDTIEGTGSDSEVSQVLSGYEDAVRTYELTWAVRLASEKSRAERHRATRG